MDSDSDADYEGKDDFSSKQEFHKIQRNLISSGFREGAAAGKDASFQTGFDTGYSEGFKAAFSLGKFNGLLDTLKRNSEGLHLDGKELDSWSFENARFGLCLGCKENPDRSVCSCKTPKDVSVLIEKQRAAVQKALDEKISKYCPMLNKAGVCDLLKDED